MEAKELRIGNYLKTDRECQDDYVEVVEIYNENYFCTCSAGLNYQKEHVKPILLTEEWLLSLGFERVTPAKNEYDNDYDYWYSYELEGFGRIALKDGVLIPDQYYFLDGLDFNLKHVHELQNLYYALTKKELTIKK